MGDSSGDLEIDNAGSVRVRDSSGDVGIGHVKGDVEVMADSSGDIEVRQVDGSVKIEQDSSGGIRVEDVRGNVTVDSDSSGDIYAGRVRGDFTVKRRQLRQYRPRGDRRQGLRAAQRRGGLTRAVRDSGRGREQRQQRQALGLLAQQRAEVVAIEEFRERRDIGRAPRQLGARRPRAACRRRSR